MSFFQGRFENTKRAFWNPMTFSLSSNLSLFHARAFPDCKITLFTFMSRFLFCVGVHSQTTWTRFCPLLTTYLGTLVLLWGKTSVYRWHFQYHLPTSSCQCSLWMPPSDNSLNIAEISWSPPLNLNFVKQKHPNTRYVFYKDSIDIFGTSVTLVCYWSNFYSS